jgi:patatin-like phospholipase/acyl hydrolase
VARREYCIPQRDSERIAMTELFDLIAGSETGAIIASTLVLPNDDKTSTQKNKYFASTSQEWFKANVDTLYKDRQMPVILKVVITVLLMSVICAVVYF